MAILISELNPDKKSVTYKKTTPSKKAKQLISHQLDNLFIRIPEDTMQNDDMTEREKRLVLIQVEKQLYRLHKLVSYN